MWSPGIAEVLVTVEFLEVGLNTLSKAAMKRGMSNYAFVVYSLALGTIFLLFTTFTFHRLTSPPPKLTSLIISKILLLGLICACLQLSIFNGIGFGSPTLASAMINLTPAYTFILAIIFRMERLDLRVRSSQAKSLGTIVSIAGAFVVTLYKGPAIAFFKPSSPPNSLREGFSPQQNWVLGGFVLAAASFLKAVLFICQTWIIKDYPAELMVTFISMGFATILAATVSLIVERDPNAWQLRPDIELASIGYSAIYGVALRTAIHIWALRLRGPVFVSMFKPLGMVIALIMGVIFLRDPLYLGSMIGATTIAIGFYFVMWGKAKETKSVESKSFINAEESSPANNAPLLQERSTEA